DRAREPRRAHPRPRRRRQDGARVEPCPPRGRGAHPRHRRHVPRARARRGRRLPPARAHRRAPAPRARRVRPPARARRGAHRRGSRDARRVRGRRGGAQAGGAGQALGGDPRRGGGARREDPRAHVARQQPAGRVRVPDGEEMTLTLALARLAWKRLWRGKMVWISGLLVLVPLSIAAIAPRDRSPERRFELIVELTLRSLVLLVPVLHLAPVVGEESERKTSTYLWSRPVPRPTLLWGNLLVILPLAAVAAAATLAAAFALIGGEVEWLARAQAGAAAGVAGASAFALGVGALFPRHPLVVTL